MENLNEFKDFLGRNWVFEDMGKAIISRKLETPGGIIYEGKYLVVNQDPAIPIPGFLVITLKRHINSFSLLTLEERQEVSNVIFKIENILKKLDISQSFTLVQEDRCPHFHIWIFPDDNWVADKYPKGVKNITEIFEYAKNNCTDEIINETLETAYKIRENVNLY